VDVERAVHRPRRPRAPAGGYSADIDLVLEAHEDAIRVPSEALMDNDTSIASTRPAAGSERVAVQTGIRNWNFTEITAGWRQATAS